jgi:hypothetical protein
MTRTRVKRVRGTALLLMVLSSLTAASQTPRADAVAQDFDTAWRSVAGEDPVLAAAVQVLVK